MSLKKFIDYLLIIVLEIFYSAWLRLTSLLSKLRETFAISKAYWGNFAKLLCSKWSISKDDCQNFWQSSLNCLWLQQLKQKSLQSRGGKKVLQIYMERNSRRREEKKKLFHFSIIKFRNIDLHDKLINCYIKQSAIKTNQLFQSTFSLSLIDRNIIEQETYNSNH